MTFGLKNAGATYQRAMNFIFYEYIGKLVEIYIDDVVVKSGDFTKHLADLQKVLESTRKHGLKTMWSIGRTVSWFHGASEGN